jgi:HEPN domain-containing protein
MYCSHLSFQKQVAWSIPMLFSLVICSAHATFAQDKGLQFLPAPPPIKSVTSVERSQLDSARDTKTRMRATIEMAEARLTRAEQLAAGEQYDAACAELGSYQGLIENFFSFLNDREPRKNKIRDILKRLEISLRAQGSRIEAIRRITPSEHAVNVKAILEFAYRARTEALNSFFGDASATETSPASEKPLNDPTSEVPASGEPTSKDTLAPALENQP